MQNTSAQKPPVTKTPENEQGEYWTPERIREAEPLPMPHADTPSKEADEQGEYWTPKRIREAEPMPLPKVDESDNDINDTSEGSSSSTGAGGAASPGSKD